MLGLSILFQMTSCDWNKQEELELDMGYDYYPLELGQERFYAVDSIVYDPVPGGTARDSSRTLVREIVADTLRDLQGQLLYRIERYERKDASLSWEIRAVYAEQQNGRQLFRTEDNLRQIKLVFPPLEGSFWNAFAFFPEITRQEVAGELLEIFKGWTPQIRTSGSPWAVNGRSYGETVEVRLAEFETRIELRRVSERYARGVGLVYREMYILDTQCIAACQNQSWEQKAEKGFILRQWRLN